MNNSTRRAWLMLPLCVALVALSFKFADMAEEPYSGRSSAVRQVLEYAGAVTVFFGAGVFAVACLFLSFRLQPKATIKFGAILLLCFIAAFFLAHPYVNPHSWTMFPFLLSMLGCLFSMLIVVVGAQRWNRHRTSAKIST